MKHEVGSWVLVPMKVTRKDSDLWRLSNEGGSVTGYLNEQNLEQCASTVAPLHEGSLARWKGYIWRVERINGTYLLISRIDESGRLIAEVVRASDEVEPLP